MSSSVSGESQPSSCCAACSAGSSQVRSRGNCDSASPTDMCAVRVTLPLLVAELAGLLNDESTNSLGQALALAEHSAEDEIADGDRTGDEADAKDEQREDRIPGDHGRSLLSRTRPCQCRCADTSTRRRRAARWCPAR